MEEITPPKLIEEPLRPVHRLINGYIKLLKEQGHKEDYSALKIMLPGNDINNLENLYNQTLTKIKTHNLTIKTKITEKELKKAQAKEAQQEIKEHQLKENERKAPYRVSSLLAQKKTKEATEYIVDFILRKENIYTTRQDNHSEMWIYHEGIYIPQGRTYIQEHCRKILGDAYTTYFCNQVISKIEADTYINQEEFFKDNNPNIVPVQNGLLNITTKTLNSFDPKQIYFNKLPAPYIPNIDCPNIKEFFKSLFKDEKETEIIQELFGFLLYDNYFIEKAVMLNGSGRNGKSKTLELMKKFIGAENCVELSLEQIEEDLFAISNLFQKKANLCGDLSKTALKTSGTFKKLTGRDMITANRKFLSPISFTNKAKMIFSCNEIPIIYDNSDAFWMRWIFLNFPYTFVSKKELDKNNELLKKADPNIIDKITDKEEMIGLLNWALDGLTRLIKNKDFSHSPSTAEVKDWWTRKSDSLKAFCMDSVKGSWDGYVSKSEFRKQYVMYCRANKTVAVSEKHIKHVLATDFGAGEEKRTIDGERLQAWVGIELLPNSTDVEGVHHVDGISPLGKKKSFAIGVNTVDTLDTLDTFVCFFIKKHQNDNIISLNSFVGEDILQKHFLDTGKIYMKTKLAYGLVDPVDEEVI